MGVSPALIGVLAVAFGTSLPELVVNIKAAMKGETDMAIGNILGSNIFNIMMVGGALGLANTAVPEAFGYASNMGLLNNTALGLSAGLLATTLLANKGEMKRWHGVTALGLYAAYTAASIYLSGSAPEAAAAAPEILNTASQAFPAALPALSIG